MIIKFKMKKRRKTSDRYIKNSKLNYLMILSRFKMKAKFETNHE